MTREQHIARELISLYEGGSRLTCEDQGHTLVIESDTGLTYRVDRDASYIRVSNGRRMDLCELEHLISGDFNDPHPFDEPTHWVEPPAPIRLATDEDWERVADLEAQGEIDRQLEEYWRREEAA